MDKSKSKPKPRPKPRPRPHNLVFLHRDRGYRFAEHDPVIAEIRSIIYASELSVQEISDKTLNTFSFRVAPGTITNWLSGKTKRPQNCTLTWVGYVLGYKRGWTKL